MANTVFSGLIPIKHITSELASSPDLFTDIRNLEVTDEGIMGTVPPQVEFVKDYGFLTPTESSLLFSRTDLKTKVFHSVFHALLDRNEDALLAYVNDALYKFEGSFNLWIKIKDDLINDELSKYPIQWVATPNGIICIPPEGNAVYYDGHICDTLGFPNSPGAPLGLGPSSSHAADRLHEYETKHGGPASFDALPKEAVYGTGLTPGQGSPSVNDLGYAHDGLVNFDTGLNPVFGKARLGTVETPEGIWNTQGKLLRSSYRCKVRFIDIWGNMSAASPPSNPITFDEQYSWYGTIIDYDDGGDTFYRRQDPSDPSVTTPDNNGAVPASSDNVKKQVCWVGIGKGPTKTIGRILYRTKDLLNSGDGRYFEVPSSALPAREDFATIPDNECTEFPDNIPDNWLIAPEEDIIAIPEFRLATIAFGRLWIANFKNGPGTLNRSIPGLWGTFLRAGQLTPDPTGRELTGLKATANGLLVFTEASTFIITSNEQGDGFITATISSTIGCVAPSSIVTTKNGNTIWLGMNAFYMWNGQEITKISIGIDLFVRKLNKGRVSRAVAVYNSKQDIYVCYAPYGGEGRNGRAFVYDGEGWRFQLPGIKVNAVCETKDHRSYIYAAGGATGIVSNVYLMNSAWGTDNTAYFRTNWVNVSRLERGAVERVFFLMRDIRYGTEVAPLKKGPGEYPNLGSNQYPVSIFVHTNGEFNNQEIARLPTTDFEVTSHYWGFAIDELARMHRSRLFWLRLDVNVNDVKSFMVEFLAVSYIEILGIAFNDIPNMDSIEHIPTYAATPYNARHMRGA